MKRLLLAILGASMLCFSSAYGQVRDWRDLEEVHKHIVEAIHEMERARAANHYDMEGYGARAEEALRHAERELHEAIEASRAHR
ncbi:exported hypothetical protein [Burkholderiales bacterium]|nr:exported hypothetical protein [Burkholderiales bacterium]